MISENLNTYLFISMALFSLGIYGILSRRNIIGILISLELLLNSVNLNLIAFSRFVLSDPSIGHLISIFVIALAAAEICVALSISIQLSRQKGSISIDDARELKG